MAAVSIIAGLLLIRRDPLPAAIAWTLLFVGIAATLYRPRYGVYQIVGFTLAGDSLLTPWFPFAKNFSSWESALYLHDAVVFSPVELFLVLTAVSVMISWISRRQPTLRTGQLFWPALFFALAIMMGLIFGISTGGVVNIALWESRSILAMPLLIILVTNTIQTREELNTLVWWAIAGICFDAVTGFVYVATDLKFDWSTVAAIAEHSDSIHINSLFVLFIGVWCYGGSLAKRLVLTSFMPFLLVTYLANQRRAGFIAMAVALAVWAVVLFWSNRRLFWIVIPPIALLTAVYLAVFWNGGAGPIGEPALMIHNSIAPAPGSEEDSSNIYRLIENVNTMFTIRSSPYIGVGFGHKFYMIVPLPDISFFVWYEYITHNSIMWIWIKSGVIGFYAMLMLVGSAIMVGSRAMLRMPGRDLSAIALMALTYIVMHFLYAYVDISWEVQSMIYVGAMMGVINSIERIAATPAAAPVT